MASKPKTTDEYLTTVDDDSKRAALERLREQIRMAAPNAEECISYSLPAFRQGRIICGFGASNKHCAFYMFNDTSLDAFAQELKGYHTSKGTIRFQPENPLPAILVRKLIKARLAEVDSAKRKPKR